MSTETQHIPPPPEHVQTFSGMPTWRIANGAICTGREADGTFQTRKQIVGYLRRVTIHHGTLEDGRAYSKVECVLETTTGEVCVGANLDSKSSSLSLGEGLLECAAGELIAIEAAQGKEKNRYGTFSTYARLFHVDPITHRSTQIRPERPTETLDEREDRILTALLKHPAYAARPERQEAGGGGQQTHLGELEKEMAARDWPPPSFAPAEWCELMTAFTERPVADLKDVTHDEWGEVRLQLQGRDKVPARLAPALERWKARGDEPDPFAKESKASALD